MATKEDLEKVESRMATKEYLKKLVPMSDVQWLAEAIEINRADIANLREAMLDGFNTVKKMITSMNKHLTRHESIFDNYDKRLRTLEGA